MTRAAWAPPTGRNRLDSTVWAIDGECTADVVDGVVTDVAIVDAAGGEQPT